MGGIVIQDIIEDALVAAIIDRGQNAEGTIMGFQEQRALNLR